MPHVAAHRHPAQAFELSEFRVCEVVIQPLVGVKRHENVADVGVDQILGESLLEIVQYGPSRTSLIFTISG